MASLFRAVILLRTTFAPRFPNVEFFRGSEVPGLGEKCCTRTVLYVRTREPTVLSYAGLDCACVLGCKGVRGWAGCVVWCGVARQLSDNTFIWCARARGVALSG